jgi:hypothetical protein
VTLKAVPLERDDGITRCPGCGERRELTRNEKRAGRPAEHCDRRCKQKAYRERKKDGRFVTKNETARETGGMSDRLFTVKEFALAVGLQPGAVYQHVAQGTLPAIRLGNGPNARIRIPASSLDSFFRPATPKETHAA